MSEIKLASQLPKGTANGLDPIVADLCGTPEHGLDFGKPLLNLSKYVTCKACPACPECGMPRATDARQVVEDYRGRYKHVTAPGDPCNDCDQHHRALLTAAV